MHTTWRHWLSRGRPAVGDYLKKHRTLYYPVALKASSEEIASLRATARVRLGIPNTAFVIGDVCRPDPQKLDYMLTAISPRLEREIGEFHIVTQRFPEKIALELRRLMGQRYHNLPFAINREQLLESYSVMDVFAHFSTMGESFGMAVAEATRCGLPIIANETPGSKQNNAQPELVKHGQTGYFANDPYTAVQRLTELARSPDLRQRMGDAGRRLYTIQPLEPLSIADQLLGEVMRISTEKNVPWSPSTQTYRRIPSNGDEELYLTHYKSSFEIPSLASPLIDRTWLYWKQAERLWWRVRRGRTGGFPTETFRRSPQIVPPPATTTADVTIVHWVPKLTPGGGLSVIDGYIRLSNPHVEHILASPRLDPDYAADLNNRGSQTAIVSDHSQLLDLLKNRTLVGIILHSGGERTPERDGLLDALASAPHCCVLERNIFGFADDGPLAKRIDLHLFNSMHTMWRHWNAVGRPPLQEYQTRHRAIYNPVTLTASGTNIAALRASVRARLGIPNDAFVIGDICRPDADKLDFMLASIAPRLARDIDSLHIVTRRFPDSIAAVLSKSLKGRYHNLPFTVNRNEVIETYAVMDAFTHFSTMGESFGMAIAEAMRCNLPVVVNETPGLNQNNAQIELVTDGQTGFIANDPYTASQRIKELANAPELRKGMGFAGGKRFSTPPLDPNFIAQQLVSEILRLTTTKTGRTTASLTPIERVPKFEDEEAFLVGYNAIYRTHSMPIPIIERPQAFTNEALRLWWRVKRKL
jgi:glycosyltransferase involved in cell wall biosynthesis